MSNLPQSYKGVINEPLIFNFSPLQKSHEKLPIPDLSVREGRLFLSEKAYKALIFLINNHGEFLPVIYGESNGYFFTPLKVAEPDNKVTFMNDHEELGSIGFIEDEVKDYAIFRTEYDVYHHLYCQQKVKDAIENAGLTGLYITTDLATIFPRNKSEVEKSN